MMTQCIRCHTTLVELDADRPTEYQYENALWIGFHGGYGMFVDNLEARLPNNTEDRWLRDTEGEYFSYTNEKGQLCPLDNPDWEPTYDEERVLPGRPDYECVLCHECAHEVCDNEPWMADLLRPLGSHAHRKQYHIDHPEHSGWDYR